LFFKKFLWLNLSTYQRLLTTNEGFKNLLLSGDSLRKALPKLIDTSQETKAWEHLRLSLGKDVSKFAIPSKRFQ